MPINADFSLISFEDGLFTVTMTPPQPVGGRNIQFTFSKRDNSPNPIAIKSIASGTPMGASGIIILDSGQGIFQAVLGSGSPEISGGPGNFFVKAEFLDNPRTCIYKGFMNLQ